MGSAVVLPLSFPLIFSSASVNTVSDGHENAELEPEKAQAPEKVQVLK